MQKDIKIQLTGELKGLLELKDGKAFPLIFQGSEVRDLAAKKGNTSRTLTLADTENNHALLNYYYNVNIVAGTFDINKLTKCIAIEDGEPLMDNAVLQLVKVIKLQEGTNGEQRAEYEVIIKDLTADFYTKLGNDELTALDFSDLDHDFTAADITGSFTNTITEGFKYLLPYNVGNNYNLTEFAMGIYAKLYFDRIFARAGFSYYWQGQTDINTRFDKWIIPYNGDAPKLREEVLEELKVKAEEATLQEFEEEQTAGLNESTPIYMLDINTETQDQSNIYDPVTSTYTSPIYSIGGGALSFKVVTEYEVYLQNNEAGTVYLKNISGLGAQKYKYTPVVLLKKSGVYFGVNSNLFSGSIIEVNQESTLPAGETILASETVERVLMDSATAGGVDYQIGTKLNVLGASFLRWKKTNSTSGIDASVDIGIRIKSISIEVTPSVSVIGYGQRIYANDFIPKKIKQSDFIKSILTLNNLYVEIDQFNSSKLILKKRDNYFDEGKQVDWTKKLAKNKEQVLQFLPALQNKKLRLTYKQDTDEANKGYLENTGEVYGQVEFTFDNEFVKETEVKEIIFSPSPMTKTTFEAVVPVINGAAPKTNIRLLYDGGAYSCEPYTITEYFNSVGNAVTTTVNSYPHLSHFDKPINPTFDLNFGLCDFYFYSSFGAKTNNNIFNLNWRRTINQINTGKMLTAYFNLNASDISKLKLSDKIFVLDTWYNINKIEYDANSKAPTKAELITVDSEQKFSKFGKKIISKPIGGDSMLNSIKNIVSKIWGSNNVVNTNAPINVMGKNNNVGSDVQAGGVYGDRNTVNTKNALIVGDGFTAEKDGIFTNAVTFPSGKTISDEDGIGENFANADLVLTGDRIQDLAAHILALLNGSVVINSGTNGTSLTVGTDDTVAAAEIFNNNGLAVALLISNGLLSLPAALEYADETAAAAAGVPSGTVYRTSTGEARIKL
jgi:hypothetical protein